MRRVAKAGRPFTDAQILEDLAGSLDREPSAAESQQKRQGRQPLGTIRAAFEAAESRKEAA